jgi:hypothetical protein
MIINRIHYLSGWVITIFVGLHLGNHLWSIWGADKHIEIMQAARVYYRNIFAETILLGAVLAQILSGMKLFRSGRKLATSKAGKLQLWTGLYLAVFFIIHVSAVLGGRLVLQLDTNFYFGVAGLNTFPLNLFFIPYYGLAILSFFGHLAAVHSKKMKHSILGLTPNRQSIFILAFGLLLTGLIFYGLTNRFKGVTTPEEYQVLIGK